MRAGLALIAALALCVTPAVAQGKVKSKGGADIGALAVEIVEVCEEFSRGDVLAVDDAIAKGWDAYEATGESPYVQTFNAHKELPGIGAADIFVLFEDYPQSTLGYCRLDVAQPKGNGKEVIDMLAGLDRYQGDVTSEDLGTYAALSGTGGENALLITHWDDVGFVIQLTIVTPKPAP